MAKNKSYKVIPRGNSWQVVFKQINGKQIRKSCKTKAQAYVWGENKAREITQYGKIAFSLSENERIDAVQALKKLPHGHSLVEAVDFYLEHFTPEGSEITVENLFDEYLQSKESAERRPRTLATIRSRIGCFIKEHPGEYVHTFTTKDLNEWLNSHKYKGIDRRNHITYLRGFFNFAIRRGYIKKNPANNLEKPSLDDKMPVILHFGEFEKLMRTVESIEPDMIPYFALCSFAGLRPAETSGLEWKDIDFNEKLITVSPQIAKKRRTRHIQMSDNLLAWLIPHRRETGTIYYSRNAFIKIKNAAKMEWEQDVLRHTYCSMHLAKNQNANLTALEMGHMNSGILYNHYRNLVSKQEAEKFWSIIPTQQSKIIKIAD